MTDAAPTLAALLERQWSLTINGAAAAAVDGGQDDVINPATEEIVARVPAGSAADVDRAVEAAKEAYPGWRRFPAAERARFVELIADSIEAHADELAWLDTIDNGSPIRMMRGDVKLAVEGLRYFAGIALELRGETLPTPDASSVDFTLREPFGVVGRIVPFNHPLMFAATKIAAPLIAGNTVVLKPSEHTPLSALRIGELSARILPPGVVNVVTGNGAEVGGRLSAHPDVLRLAFTGSVAVGLRVQQQAASSRIKVVTLELGGKNPLIVFDDADRDAAVLGALRGMNFTWQGQSCGSTSRLYIQRPLWSSFIEALAAKMDELVVGDPTADTTDVGAIVAKSQYEKVVSYLEQGANDPDAHLVTGGVAGEQQRGYFVRPTLFTLPRGSHSGLAANEIFGPILTAIPFDSYEEVIGLANGLQVGLTASVWTTSLETALRATKDLEAGYVWINSSSQHIPGAAFGGVKDSGVGREEGIEELYSYTQSKNVYLRFRTEGGSH